jgi:hypothetical protein
MLDSSGSAEANATRMYVDLLAVFDKRVLTYLAVQNEEKPSKGLHYRLEFYLGRSLGLTLS